MIVSLYLKNKYLWIIKTERYFKKISVIYKGWYTYEKTIFWCPIQALSIQIQDLDVQARDFDIRIQIWMSKPQIWTSKSLLWTSKPRIWTSRSQIWIWTSRSRFGMSKSWIFAVFLFKFSKIALPLLYHRRHLLDVLDSIRSHRLHQPRHNPRHRSRII